jgi:hypothetical protein
MRTVSSPATRFISLVEHSISSTIVLLLNRKNLRHRFFVVQNSIRPSAVDIVLEISGLGSTGVQSGELTLLPLP